MRVPKELAIERVIFSFSMASISVVVERLSLRTHSPIRVLSHRTRSRQSESTVEWILRLLGTNWPSRSFIPSVIDESFLRLPVIERKHQAKQSAIEQITIFHLLHSWASSSNMSIRSCIQCIQVYSLFSHRTRALRNPQSSNGSLLRLTCFSLQRTRISKWFGHWTNSHHYPPSRAFSHQMKALKVLQPLSESP